VITLLSWTNVHIDQQRFATSPDFLCPIRALRSEDLSREIINFTTPPRPMGAHGNVHMLTERSRGPGALQRVEE